MGTGRTLHKNPRTRPVKSESERARRIKTQRARLVKWGMDSSVVEGLQPDVVRTLVQKPAMVAKLITQEGTAFATTLANV